MCILSRTDWRNILRIHHFKVKGLKTQVFEFEFAMAGLCAMAGEPFEFDWTWSVERKSYLLCVHYNDSITYNNLTSSVF